LNTHDFELLTNQHQMIREKIRVFQEQWGMLKELTEAHIEGIEMDLKILIQLLDAHSKCEEQMLMPILKEMYPSQPKILRYVEDDHVEVERGLSELVDTPLTTGNITIIKSLLNRMVVHFVEEERGLFPLIKVFLKSKI
jgi:iron-sulfur cluster repair protein YtfE (RIC family)